MRQNQPPLRGLTTIAEAGWQVLCLVAKSHPAAKTPQWTPAPDLPANRAYSAAVTTGDKLYVVGGEAGTDVFDLIGNVWSSLKSGPSHRDFLGAAAVSNHVYAVGGLDGGRNLSGVEVLDIAAGSWRPASTTNLTLR